MASKGLQETSGVARGGAGGGQAPGGAPAQLQRRSQVSLAGGLTEFQGGDKPQYL